VAGFYTARSRPIPPLKWQTFAALCIKRTIPDPTPKCLNPLVFPMLDKSIDAALMELRTRIVRGGLEGREHVEALLIARGVPLRRVSRQLVAIRLPRNHLRLMILAALRDGPMTGPAIAAIVIERTPQIAPEHAYFRAYSAVTRMRYAGLVEKDGKVWQVVKALLFVFALWQLFVFEASVYEGCYSSDRTGTQEKTGHRHSTS